MIVRKLVAGLRKWGDRPGQKGLHVFTDIITEPEIVGPVLTAMISHHNLIAEHNSLWEDDERDYNVKRLLVMPMFRVGVLPLALSHRLAPGVHSVLTYFRNATSLYNGILSCQL